MTDAMSGDHVCDNLDKYVVKAVGESGGYGMLIGPHSSQRAARPISRQRSWRIRAITLRSRRSLFPRLPASWMEAYRAAPRGSPALCAVWRKDHDCSGRVDARGAAEGVAGGEFFAGRRLERYLGADELSELKLMLSRVADSLYWMSRYFERADNARACSRPTII